TLPEENREMRPRVDESVVKSKEKGLLIDVQEDSDSDDEEYDLKDHFNVEDEDNDWGYEDSDYDVDNEVEFAGIEHEERAQVELEEKETESDVPLDDMRSIGSSDASNQVSDGEEEEVYEKLSHF
ncbi:hypothetical protein Dimus_002778, partial [Dionaea muscipula]